MAHILLRHRDIPDLHQLDVYLENGGYEGFKKCLSKMEPADVINVVRAANVRGRGGAGFSAGIKWGFIPKAAETVYVIINSDESETGTFKDRELLTYNPHQVIEGALIAAYAVGATAIYNYFRGEYMDIAYNFEQAVKDCYANGLLGEDIQGSGFSCDLYATYGAGAYICGEESALIESLHGNLGQPWPKPPFPAQEGLYKQPTVVNNVETLCNVPPVIVNGDSWYTAMGTEQSSGVKVVCLSGHINKPGNYEVEMGLSYRELIFSAEYGGGVPGDKAVKAVLPSGGSGPVITAAMLDAPLSFEGLVPHGSAMGSASVIVMDETTDMVWAALKMIKFFKHESCGKCTPCREGTFWLERLLARINRGEGTEADVQLLENVARQIQGKCLCALGEFAVSPVLSTIAHFLDDYKAKINEGRQVRVAAEPVGASA